MKRLKILLQSNGFYLLFFSFVCFYCFIKTQVITYHTSIPKNTTQLTGKLLSYTIDGDKVSLLLKTQEKITSTYYVKSKEEKESLEKNLKVGITITLYGKEKEVIGETIPNTFDYKKYLEHERIYYAFSASKIEIVNTELSFLNKIKNGINERMKKLGNNPYLKAFVIGDKTLIASEEYERIMNNGVGHLFALSGMHLSFVYLFLNKLLKKVKLKNVFIYSFLLLYLFITGFSISFLRAILFLLLLDANKKFKWNLSSIKILFLTAFLLLLYNPFYIYNIGFWYTFVVTFSLLYTSDEIKKHKKGTQVFLVSLITFFFSLPISIYINYEINVFSILANIVFVPFISTFVFPMAIFTFFCPILMPILEVFLKILEVLNQAFENCAIFLIFGKINLLEVLLLYGLLLIGVKVKRKKYSVFLLLFLLFLYNKNLLENFYSVYFLDVGQGDSALFVAPRNKEVLLIDSGGEVATLKKDYQIRNKEFKLSDNIITFLKSKRIRSIDLFVATHGDLDHLGYASAIGKSIPFKQVLLNRGEKNEKELELLNTYKSVENYTSKYFDFKTYRLKTYTNENDNSTIAKLKIGAQTFLMMGDASSKVEKELLEKEKNPITFLKVGHHGSKTSTSEEFVKTINPKYAIISVGRNNRYGHPNQEVLERLKNVKIYRTDLTGTITLKIKKNDFNITTCLS